MSESEWCVCWSGEPVQSVSLPFCPMSATPTTYEVGVGKSMAGGANDPQQRQSSH